MDTVTIHAAKTTLSKLIARVEAGEEIMLARGKTPVAKIVPLREPSRERRPGAWRGKVEVGPAFFKPMSPEELGEWE